MWLIAFSRGHHAEQSGQWRTVLNASTGRKSIAQVSKVGAFDTLAMQQYVRQHYQPGNTHLVAGTHGQGDFLWLNGLTTDGGATVQGNMTEAGGVSLPLGDFVSYLREFRFLSITLDACLMGEVYGVAALAAITPIVAACEGFMWADDRDLSGSVFNCRLMRGLSDPRVNTLTALTQGGEFYVSRDSRADLSVYRAVSAQALLTYVLRHPKYSRQMQAHVDSINADTLTFLPSNFYRVEDDPDVWDAVYLLDLAHFLAGDTVGLGLLESVVSWHAGPRSPKDGNYSFKLPGLSITVGYFNSSTGVPMLPAIKLGPGLCRSELDCNLNGRCGPGGRCVCVAPWTAHPNCGALAFLPQPAAHAYGDSRRNHTTWGGGVLGDGAGRYHLYAAAMTHGCLLKRWGGNSRVEHAVSDSPLGPFHFSDVAIGVEAHNPAPFKLTDGRYAIWHIGLGVNGSDGGRVCTDSPCCLPKWSPCSPSPPPPSPWV